MSFNYKTIMFVALLVGGVLGSFATPWHLTRGKQKDSDRQPASIQTNKPDITITDRDILPHTRKLKSPFAVVIEGASTPPGENDNFSLTAHLDGANLSGQFHYHWILPEGVSMASGSAQDGMMTAGDNLTTEFVHHSIKNQILKLRVESVSSIGLGASGQYHTLDQQKILTETADIMSRQKEYLANHQELIKHDH